MAGEVLDNRGRGDARWHWPQVHPEGRKYAVIAAGLTLFFAYMAWETLAWPMAAVTVWVLAFFRDPARVVPQDDSLVIAPADGMITCIATTSLPLELLVDDAAQMRTVIGEPVTRISIFMSVFDMHINRSPIAGMVRRIAYIPGKFVNAELDKASEDNERQHTLIERSDGVQVGLTQIAGVVARRIVPFVKPGDQVGAGQRIGLIRFGSRVDVFLPHGTEPCVVLGQRTIAGETVLARLGEASLIEGYAL
ncbi:phosphatidylserine decarboxylase [Croceicoccus sp. F390]|uniref:Phosphatidylserine decarboxylase proenzyme n=1 Tax=Croceicoccus esteveae TaxID=3075597 RepID=A0ABU2ZIW6_9SPHN|nr:phosphatidylserine decarboxylase [Croceicoccus sp. F390]MDT0576563.1 phosphatidylserine decarboxylase [Croceicoccus sp. F390]